MIKEEHPTDFNYETSISEEEIELSNIDLKKIHKKYAKESVALSMVDNMEEGAAYVAIYNTKEEKDFMGNIHISSKMQILKLAEDIIPVKCGYCKNAFATLNADFRESANNPTPHKYVYCTECKNRLMVTRKNLFEGDGE